MNSLSKLFGASKGVAKEKISDSKVPTTRQSVKTLVQLYLDRAVLYPSKNEMPGTILIK